MAGRRTTTQHGWVAQDVDSLAGKILHLDRDGLGLPTNPYWSGDAKANRSKVWATGLRNPFRMSLLEGESVRLAVGDVGWRHWEEVDLVERGDDLGWPCREGGEANDFYADLDACEGDDGHPKAPWIALSNPDQGFSVIGGVRLDRAASLPDRYRRLYVFADWGVNRLYLAESETSASFATLAEGAGGPLSFEVSSAGELYYLAGNLGEIRAISAR